MRSALLTVCLLSPAIAALGAPAQTAPAQSGWEARAVAVPNPVRAGGCSAVVVEPVDDHGYRRTTLSTGVQLDKRNYKYEVSDAAHFVVHNDPAMWGYVCADSTTPSMSTMITVTLPDGMKGSVQLFALAKGAPPARAVVYRKQAPLRLPSSPEYAPGFVASAADPTYASTANTGGSKSAGPTDPSASNTGSATGAGGAAASSGGSTAGHGGAGGAGSASGGTTGGAGPSTTHSGSSTGGAADASGAAGHGGAGGAGGASGGTAGEAGPSTTHNGASAGGAADASGAAGHGGAGGAGSASGGAAGGAGPSTTHSGSSTGGAADASGAAGHGGAGGAGGASGGTAGGAGPSTTHNGASAGGAADAAGTAGHGGSASAGGAAGASVPSTSTTPNSAPAGTNRTSLPRRQKLLSIVITANTISLTGAYTPHPSPSKISAAAPNRPAPSKKPTTP